MSLKDINLAQINPTNRQESQFSVTAYSDTGNLGVTFACSSEFSARSLRDAIREHADRLVSVDVFEELYPGESAS